MHPNITNFDIAEINKDWKKSEVLNKKWVLIASTLFSLSLDIFVHVFDKPNDLASKIGKYSRIAMLVLLMWLIYMIYRTDEVKSSEIKKNKKIGPYEETG